MKKLVAIVLTICLAFTIAISAYATDSTNAQSQSFPIKLSALYNKDEQAMLSVSSNELLDTNGSLNITVTDAQSTLIGSGNITDSFSSILIGPLSIGVNYTISTNGSNQTDVSSEKFSIQANNSTLSVVINPASSANSFSPTIVQATAEPTLYVYPSASATGTQWVATYTGNNIFKAIDSLHVYSGSSNAYISEGIYSGGTNKIYIRNGSTTTYWKFQFAKGYGQAADVTAANNWIGGYWYAHIVRGDGTFGQSQIFNGNSYRPAKGTPGDWTLEPQAGGYVYKFATNGYVKQTATLSSFSCSVGNGTWNPYAYLSSQNGSTTSDAGFHADTSNGAAMIIVGDGNATRAVNNNTGVTIYPSGGMMKLMDLGTLTRSGNTWTLPSAITFTYTLGNGSYVFQVTYNSVTTSFTVYDPYITTSNMALMQNTSLVPTTFYTTPDYRNGNTLNATWTNSLVYNSSGTSYAFYGTSSATNYAFAYNDDCCTYTPGSSSDSISIFYNRPWTT